MMRWSHVFTNLIEKVDEIHVTLNSYKFYLKKASGFE